jgi:drug/metabolite transporter (DMT)-like permease
MLGFTLAGVIAFWLVIEGFKYVDASIGGLIGLLEIVFAIIFGALFFSEEITLPIIVGSLLIISAVIIPNIKQKLL